MSGLGTQQSEQCTQSMQFVIACALSSPLLTPIDALLNWPIEDHPLSLSSPIWQLSWLVDEGQEQSDLHLLWLAGHAGLVPSGLFLQPICRSVGNRQPQSLNYNGRHILLASPVYYSPSSSICNLLFAASFASICTMTTHACSM